MTARSLLNEKRPGVIAARLDETLAEAAARLSSNKIGAVVVLDENEHLAGILSERDIVREVANRGAECLSTRVADIMTSKVVTCAPTDSIDDLMGKMTDGRFRHVPVVDNNQVVGVISIGDVVKRRIADAEHEAREMRAYIATG